MARRKYFSTDDLGSSAPDAPEDDVLIDIEADLDDEEGEILVSLKEYNALKNAVRMIADAMIRPTMYHWDAHNNDHNFEPVFSKTQIESLEGWLK